MKPQIHAAAIVEDGATLGPGVEVGPFAMVSAESVVGEGTKLGPRATLLGSVRIGQRCNIGVGAVIGGLPQDFKFDGMDTGVEIGNETRIGEYVTIHRGTQALGKTLVGAHCFLMSYVHVAHDCVIEDNVIVANAVQLGGHVKIEHDAQVGGLAPVHQFVRIGAYAFVGGGSRIPQDIPPFAKAAGNPVKLFGINSVGLKRAGFSVSVQNAIKRAHRLLFNSNLTRREALESVDETLSDVAEVSYLVKFLAETQRGVTV